MTRLNTYNPKYPQAYADFISSKSSSGEFNGWFKQQNPYLNALSLAHNLQQLEIYDDLLAWSNAHVDYLDPTYNAQQCVGQMHALTVMLMGSQKKFVERPVLKMMVLEALKACASNSVSSISQSIGLIVTCTCAALFHCVHALLC